MTKTMNHTNCTHPATKAGRAKCRRDAAKAAAEYRATLTALVDSYYDNTADIEEVIAGLHRLNPELTKHYYDETLDAEEVIARAH
jgi:hypothetical protein